MLSTIALLTAMAFAAIYPLCFLISADDPLKNKFHKFHLGLPNTVGGVVLVFVWLMDLPLALKIYVALWKIVFISVSRFYWKKEYPNPKMILLPCLLGLFAFIELQKHLIGPGWNVAGISILNGLIFCSSLYAMNLGHEYLNVHGLPHKHLMRTINIFWLLLGIRAVWNAVTFAIGDVWYNGELLALPRFLTTMDGFLLAIAVFFGTVFPVVAIYFAREVLKLKNTQSTTGILYVILCSVIIGDIGYKYYLVKYGITL